MRDYERMFCQEHAKAFAKFVCEREIQRLESELKYANDRVPILQALLDDERRKLNALPR